MNSEIIGKRIKILLVLKNVKRSYLAEKLGISYNTLTKKLNAKRQFTIIEILKIKDILNIDCELFGNILFNLNYLI